MKLTQNEIDDIINTLNEYGGQDDNGCWNELDKRLESVIKNDDKESVELLIKNGLKMSTRFQTNDEFGEGWKYKQEGNLSQLAIFYGSYEILKVCLKAGADVEAHKSQRASTAITEAVYSGSVNIIKLLLESGSDINGNGICRNPLEEAIKSNQTDIIKYLIENGATFDINNISLHDTVFDNYYELVEIYIGYGADVNKQNKSGRTPLYIAIEYGYSKIAELLISHGAKENFKNNSINADVKLTNEKFDNLDTFIGNYINVIIMIKRNGKDKAYFKLREETDPQMIFLSNFILFIDKFPNTVESKINEVYENSRFRDILLLFVKLYIDDESVGDMKMYLSCIIIEDKDSDYGNDIDTWFNDESKYLKDIEYGKKLYKHAEINGVMAIENMVYESDIDQVIKELLNLLIDNTKKETIQKLFQIKKENTIWYVKEYLEKTPNKDNCQEYIAHIEKYFKYLDEIIDMIE